MLQQQQQQQHQQHQPALLGSMEGYFTLSQQQPKQIFEEDFQKKEKEEVKGRKEGRRTTFCFLTKAARFKKRPNLAKISSFQNSLFSIRKQTTATKFIKYQNIIIP